MGCRQRTAKSELLRVVAGKGADGRAAVVPDPSATAPGRGAHLHPTSECLQLAVRRRAFPRALRVREGLDHAPLEEHLLARPTVIDRPETGAGSS
ncbi:YlxR family protein [Nocardioides campestrisoli]|uniref:YlxR family protein n=1 Tax=Nocardioides campestrisoli TaxID=2736757 RepID=UPI001CD3A5D0|nr:YlxR family protein [Nocardioides campestrisoli]